MSEIPIIFLTDSEAENPDFFSKFALITRRQASKASFSVGETQPDLIISRTYQIRNEKITCISTDLGDIQVGKWISEEYDWEQYANNGVISLDPTTTSTDPYPLNMQKLQDLNSILSKVINFTIDEKSLTLLFRDFKSSGYMEPTLSNYVIKRHYELCLESNRLKKVKEIRGMIRSGYRTPDIVKWSNKFKPELVELQNSYRQKKAIAEMKKLGNLKVSHITAAPSGWVNGFSFQA